ncbi:MAG: TerC family protein [Spirosomaceae bacterium]|nr:TerC family protein [Spirosomataceae bacterium]
MDSQTLIALVSLIALEVVLGIDNIIFITILAGKLPVEQQAKVRYIGIGLAMVMRLGLLALISWIMKLDQTLFTVINQNITGKELILILGGLFLLYKSAKEIYHKVEAKEENNLAKGAATFGSVLLQVLLLDLVFSIDSIITAVGMVDELWVMYTAVVVTVLIMLVAAKPISDFVNKHPAFKVLALSFLMMIGMALLAEGFEIHIPKGYIYFSMAFALLVDVIQMKTGVSGNKNK